MIETPILSKLDNESFMEYHIRLYDNKEEYGIDKFKIADLLNKEYGSSFDESKWRKDYAQYLKWKEFIISQNLDEQILEKYEEVRIESEKERIRKNDQKREYRKLIANQARFEDLARKVQDSILLIEKKKPLEFSLPSSPSLAEKHGLALFSDWHFGMDVNNSMNKFNKDVFFERVNKLTNSIIDKGKKNEISTLHVANLGDLLSGIIHVSTRVQSNEDIIEQTQLVSETLAEVLVKLACNFETINFYHLVGNHGRTGNKNDVGMKENFEYLISWYLEARLRDVINVNIVTEQDGYLATQILGKRLIFVHGNYDRIDQCVTRLPQMLGYIPDYIIGGHIHHNYEKEHGKTTVIVNGSLIGMDDYAMQGRFAARPSQKFIVFDENEGLEATYIIRF
ncbi:hypothetical protein WKH57_00930 [Niallia taxi]|uniref:hypothetical protein n=1 Tax=Niallia taxi TaxID=2499688 RepID=UPI00316B4C14